MHPDIGDFLAPTARENEVLFDADKLVAASGQGVMLDVMHAPFDDLCTQNHQVHPI